MNLGELNIEGFGSIKNATFNFNRVGLNLLLGKNGSGKTTILNALAWVIYGKPLKGINIQPWPHLIDKNYKGTKVGIKLYDGDENWEIIRCQDYSAKIGGKKGKSGLFVYYMDSLVEIKGKRDLQPYILEKIGYSFELFKNTILFGQKLKRLIEETGPDKKKLFDEAFDSVFISRAREAVEKRYSQRASDYEAKVNEYKELLNATTSTKELIRANKEIRQNFYKSQSDRSDQILKKIEEAKNRLENLRTQSGFKNLPSLIRKLAGKEEKLIKLIEANKSDSIEFDLSLRINRNEQDIEILENNIGDLENSILSVKGVCDTCGQKLPKDKVKEYRQNLFKQKKVVIQHRLDLVKLFDHLTAERITALEGIAEKTKLKERLNKVRAKLAKLKKHELEIGLIEDGIKTTYAQIKTLEEQLKEILGEKPPKTHIKKFRVKLLGLITQREEALSTVNSLKKKLEIDKWLINDPLGNSGLKSFIFDSMMGRVNKYLRSYKNLVGFDIAVKVDLESARKDINIFITKEDDEIPYEDLSGGEKQLVDVVMAFSLNDVVNESKPLNVLILDELFESLDADNIEKVGNIIQSKAKNRAIFLITHQSSFIPTNAKLITIWKSAGFTVIRD
jgi:DNA repair exonuclease SbcCD ATPase subunit